MDSSERIARITDNDELGRLLQEAGEIKDRLDAAKAARAEGKAISDSVAELTQQVAAANAKIDDWQRAENERLASARLDALLSDHGSVMDKLRLPSKAAAFTAPSPSAGQPEHGFLYAIAMARSRDYDEQRYGKALLQQLGVDGYTKANTGGVIGDVEGKATLGTTNAAGGFIVPNASLTTIIEQATVPRSVVDLFTVVNGVNGNSIQIPFENSATTRAVIAAVGATKENQDFVVGAYTATLYTLARIFDVSNQLLRQSEGAAEALVRSRLARAFGLGEDYYALSGSGSSEPYGLLTAIGTSGTYVTTFSSPSDSTVAGSIIAAVITAQGDLANRGAIPDGVVLNTANFYQMRRQGSDEAGFWVDPFGDVPDIGDDARGPLGLRWRHSPNMTTDNLVVGEYRSALFIRGLGYRVDVSSEAGTRWDSNLTGFRGEEEIAFDARPPVYSGRFQRITNAIA